MYLNILYLSLLGFMEVDDSANFSLFVVDEVTNSFDFSTNSHTSIVRLLAGLVLFNGTSHPHHRRLFAIVTVDPHQADLRLE